MDVEGVASWMERSEAVATARQSVEAFLAVHRSVVAELSKRIGGSQDKNLRIPKEERDKFLSRLDVHFPPLDPHAKLSTLKESAAALRKVLTTWPVIEGAVQ